MTDLPKTFLLAVETHNGVMIIEADEKAWKKLSPTLVYARHVIDVNVFHLKAQGWLAVDDLSEALDAWVAEHIGVPF